MVKIIENLQKQKKSYQKIMTAKIDDVYLLFCVDTFQFDISADKFFFFSKKIFIQNLHDFCCSVTSFAFLALKKKNL